MSKIDGFLLDVDGCILSTTGDVSSLYYYALIELYRYVMEANEGRFPTIMLCSGRDRNYIEAVAFMIGLPDSLSVIESGIALFNPTTKKLIVNPALTPETKRTFREIAEKQIPRILKRLPGLFLYPGNMINVAIEREYGSDASIEEAYESLKRELENLIEKGVIEIHHSDSAVDISPRGIDKASGIKFLAELTGINPMQIVGIGDTNGDAPMMELVGYVGCPTNASEGCKKLVAEKNGYISPLPYAAGVIDIIKHYIQGS